MCRPFPCGPFCLSCLLPSILSSLRHPALVPSVYPPTRPSSHQAIGPSIHLAFFPSLSLLAAPAFFPGLVPGSVLLGPPFRGRTSTPVFPTSPALLHDRPSRGPSRDSSRRLFPETLSEELCWSIVPKPPCLPQSFSPPATRLLSSDIGNPCKKAFPHGCLHGRPYGTPHGMLQERVFRILCQRLGPSCLASCGAVALRPIVC